VQARAHAIQKSCADKAAIVAEDETEQGVRALLNLGHTFGHALEQATGYSQTLLHGEAVAIGMVQAFLFSEARGLCAKGTGARVATHLTSAGLPTRLADVPGELPTLSALVDIMYQDKKAVGGELTFILAKGIGEAFIARKVPGADVIEFLNKDRQR
jgi:3-dehydroquinate synthetase